MCTGWSAIYVGAGDKLSDGTSRQLLKHNEYGAALKCPAFQPKSGS